LERTVGAKHVDASVKREAEVSGMPLSFCRLSRTSKPFFQDAALDASVAVMEGGKKVDISDPSSAKVTFPGLLLVTISENDELSLSVSSISFCLQGIVGFKCLSSASSIGDI